MSQPNRKARRTAAATGASPVSLPQAKPEPRSQSEIQTEYGKVCAQLGEITYRMKVDSVNQERALQHINSLEQEMKARLELDKQAQSQVSGTTPQP